jgi:hypothetical protein
MTDREQKDLRSYCAYLLDEHGFHFSPTDPVIPALYIMYKENQANIKAYQTVITEIEKASAKLNPKVYNFQVEGEAWDFQLGNVLKWVAIALAIGLFSVIGAWYWSAKSNVAKARSIVNEYRYLEGLRKLIQKSDDGLYFIDFIHFKKIDAKTIRVYVERDSTNQFKK